MCIRDRYLFVRSKYGRTVQAIREDYIAASASGINVTYYLSLIHISRASCIRWRSPVERVAAARSNAR